VCTMAAAGGGGGSGSGGGAVGGGGGGNRHPFASVVGSLEEVLGFAPTRSVVSDEYTAAGRVVYLRGDDGR
jgi:hypothetical protein